MFIFVPPDLRDPATMTEVELKEEIRNHESGIINHNKRIELLNKRLDKVAPGNYDGASFTERNTTQRIVAFCYERIKLLQNQGLIKYSENVRLRRSAAGSDTDGMKAALRDGANVNCYDANLNTPLMLAKTSECVDFLMGKAADINAVNNEGRTALHIAAGAGNSSVVKALVSWECRKTIKDNSGKTALALATQAGHNECILALGGKVSAPVASRRANPSPETVSISASSAANAASVSASSRKARNESFMNACHQGQVQEARRLFLEGVEVNCARWDQRGPLLVALTSGKEELIDMILGHPDINVNVVDNTFNQTPLQWAAINGRENRINQLLLLGAHVDMVNKYGMTPLHHALSSNSGRSKRISMAKILINAGANPSLKTTGPYYGIPVGSNAYDVAKKNFVIEEFNAAIIEHANTRTPTGTRSYKLFFDACKAGDKSIAAGIYTSGRSGNVNWQCLDEEMKTPLLIAIEHKRTDVVDYLLSIQEIDINLSDSKYRTPLHWASWYGDNKTVVQLLKMGAHSNASNWTGMTPLHIAVYVKSMSTARILLGANSSINEYTTRQYDDCPPGSNVEKVAELRGVAVEFARVVTEHNRVTNLLADVNAVTTAAAVPVNLPTRPDNAFYLLCKNGDLATIRATCSTRVLNQTSGRGKQRTALMAAIVRRYHTVAHYLLEQPGLNINARDAKNRTALHRAAWNGDRTLLRSFPAGTDANVISDLGVTALHMTIAQRNLYNSGILMAMGASTTIRTKAEYMRHPADCSAHDIADRCQLGDLLHGLLDNGGDVGILLILASKAGDTFEVGRLLDIGVNINTRCRSHKSTPFIEACIAGHEATVAYLLTRPDLDVKISRQNGWTGLHSLAARGMIDLINPVIARGSSINACQPGVAPLHLAVYSKHFHVAKLLLAAGADPQLKTTTLLTDEARVIIIPKGSNAGDIARLHGLESDWAALVEPNTPNLHDSSLVPASQSSAVSPLVISASTISNESKLYDACVAGDLVEVKRLTTGTIDINYQQPDGGDTPLLAACKNYNEPIIRHLLGCTGIDVNKVGKTKASPLEWMTCLGNIEIIETILQLGADVNNVNWAGVTPLHEAIIRHDSIRLAKILVDAGADVNIRTIAEYNSISEGSTPYDIAKRANKLELYGGILSPKSNPITTTTPASTADAQLYAACREGDLLRVRFLLSQTNINYRESTANNQTSILAAFRRKHIGIVNLLLNQPQLDINQCGDDGRTVLERAAWYGNKALLTRVIELGANINSQNSHGITPLHTALLAGSMTMTKILLAHGARTNIKTTRATPECPAGMTAFELADHLGLGTKFREVLKLETQVTSMDTSTPAVTAKPETQSRLSSADQGAANKLAISLPVIPTTPHSSVTELANLRLADTLPARELNQRYASAATQNTTNPDFYVEYGHFYYDSYKKEKDAFRRVVLRSKGIEMYEKAITLDPFLPDISQHEELKQA